MAVVKENAAVAKRSYSVDELAAMFGLSADYFYQVIKRGELQVIRAGRRLLVPVASVEAWEKSNTESWSAKYQ